MSNLFLPTIGPQKTVSEYKLSKDVNTMTKLQPNFDIRLDDTKAYLASLQLRLLDVEHKINKNKEKRMAVREHLDKQWQSLTEKEQSLRENFEHFDKFVHENLEKRERAEKKIAEDKEVTRKRVAAINEVKAKIKDITHAKLEMDDTIKRFFLFEKFLRQVVERTEFHRITDVILRYLSLISARSTLTERQEEYMKAIEHGRSEMIKLTEEKRFIIMGLNNQLANLQARFESATIRALDGEQLVVQIKNSAVKQINEIDEAKAAIWNIYQQMTISKKHLSIKIKKEDVEQQIMYIKRTLSELARVNQMIKGKSKSTYKVRDKRL